MNLTNTPLRHRALYMTSELAYRCRKWRVSPRSRLPGVDGVEVNRLKYYMLSWACCLGHAALLLLVCTIYKVCSEA